MSIYMVNRSHKHTMWREGGEYHDDDDDFNKMTMMVAGHTVH